MQAYRVETIVEQNGTLTLQSLPLQAGEAVEVIILVRPPYPQPARYSLRGIVISYKNPTDTVVNIHNNEIWLSNAENTIRNLTTLFRLPMRRKAIQPSYYEC
jgi:hypothetical protein